MKQTDIITALRHPKIWGSWLEPDPSSRAAWLSLWRGIFGLPMDDPCRKTFEECTGRAVPAPLGYREIYVIVGRRGGKTFFMAVTGVFLACFRRWKATPGERLVVLLVAVTARQAKALMGYIRGLLEGVPALKGLITRSTQTEIELSTGVSIVIEVADFRSVRGSTIVAGLVDEAAFLPPDGSATDKELLIAIRAGMISVPNSILIVGSTPYSKRGEVWNAHRAWFGKPDAKELVWVAPSLRMNPTLDARIVEQALEDDPASARAEYLAEFRDDVSGFVDREVVEAAVIRGRFEIAPPEELAA